MLCCSFCFPALTEASWDTPGESGGSPEEFGDEAFDIATTQMISLLEYADMFKPARTPAAP